MKTSKIKLTTLAMAAFCLAFLTWLPNQGAMALQQEQQQEDDVQLGQDQEYGEKQKDKKGHKASKLTNKKVVDSEGNELGTISDIAVDMQNSRITYVLVSDQTSGQDQLGQTEDQQGQQGQQDPTEQDPTQEDPLEQDPMDQDHQQEGMQQPQMQSGSSGQFKAIPPQALSENSDGGFSVDIDQQQWAEAPSFGKQELAQQGLDEQQGQEVYAFYDQEWETGDLSLLESQSQQSEPGLFDQEDTEPDTESGPSVANVQEQPQSMGQQQSELKFLEDLKGKKVVSQEQEEIGDVEEFLLDLEEGRLAFVVVSASGKIGSKQSQEDGEYGQQQDYDTDMGQQEQDNDMGQDDQNNDIGQQDQTGREAQAGQAGHQTGQMSARQSGDRYAIIPNAFQDSPRSGSMSDSQSQTEGQQDQQQQDDPYGQEDQQDDQKDQDSQQQQGQQGQQQYGQSAQSSQDQLRVDISIDEFEQAPELKGDEWASADMQTLGNSEVFRYIEDDSESSDKSSGESKRDEESEESTEWEPNGSASLMQDAQHQQSQDQKSRTEKKDKKGHKASNLIGYDIINQQDESLGSIEDFAIDLQNSRITYVVVSEGGLLGVGEDLKAVPPQAFQFSQEDEQLVLDIDENRWEEAPTFESKDELAEMGGEQQAQEIYAFFDQQYDSGDLGMLEQDQQQGQTQDQQNEMDAGPSVQDSQQSQQGQQTNRLHFIDDLTGNEIVNNQQEEVGDVEDFLVEIQEGRLGFVVINVDDDFLGDNQEQSQQGADYGQEQQENQQDQQQQGQQQQDNGLMGSNNQYAVAPNSFQIDPQDEERLILDLDRQEFAQATERLNSENWTEKSRDMMGQNNVFLYEEGDNSEWGASDEGNRQEGYREDSGTERDTDRNTERGTERTERDNDETTSGQQAGVVQQDQNQQDQNRQDQDRQDQDRQQQGQMDQQRNNQQSMVGQRGIKASEIIGQDVVNQEDESLGSLSDLAIDLENSRVVYALVSTGGFLGIGAETRVVPPQAIQHSEDQLVINIEENRWEDAPAYDKEEIAEMTDESQGSEIYAFFDQQWDDSPGMRTGDRAETMPQTGQQNEDDPFYSDDNTQPEEAEGGEGIQVEDDENPQQTDQQSSQQQQSRSDDMGQNQTMSQGNKLVFIDDLTGSNVVGPNQEEIGEIEEFLVQLEDGRASFIVVNVSDDFMQEQAGDAEGMDTGLGDNGTQEGAGQPGETDNPQDPTGQQQQQQAQEGRQITQESDNNKYAIIVSAFRVSSEDENELLLEQVDRREFEQAESLDEHWSGMDMEATTGNRVFRYQDIESGTTAEAERGTGQEPENGIFRNRN
ncbi:MAG: PRC-barrel domain-containing protein [Balneolales bacterium]